MPSDTPSSSVLRGQVTRLEVVSVGARQRWTCERKRELVRETFAPGASVTGVARSGGVSRSLLFAWRKHLRAELGFPEASPAKLQAPPRFLQLAIAAEPGAPPATIELEIPGGVRMKFSGAVDAGLAAMIVKALSRR